MSLKIIVENEEQKSILFDALSKSDCCPGEFGLKESSVDCVNGNSSRICKNCWEQSGLKIVVGEEGKASNTVSDLELFAKILGEAAASASYSCEKLAKRVDILEKRCEHLRSYIEDEFGLAETQIERVLQDGRLTYNDKRFLLKLPEIDDPNELIKKGKFV